MSERDETRSEQEIRYDLATEEGRGAMQRLSPIGRLVADVPGLLADRSRLERENTELRAENQRLRAENEHDTYVCAWKRRYDAARAEADQLREAVRDWAAENEIAAPPLDWQALGTILAAGGSR